MSVIIISNPLGLQQLNLYLPSISSSRSASPSLVLPILLLCTAKHPYWSHSKAQTKNLSVCHLLRRCHLSFWSGWGEFGKHSKRQRGGAGTGGRVKDFHAQQKNLSQLFMALAGTHNRTHQTAVFFPPFQFFFAFSSPPRRWAPSRRWLPCRSGSQASLALHIQFPRQWRSTWGSDSDKYRRPHRKLGRLLHEWLRQ